MATMSGFAAPLVMLAACGPASAGTDTTASPQRAARPTLVVMITVDQLRADYLERWRGQFTGGLKRLLDQGAVFTNAHQDHAITETAPGHASTMSGRFPRSTGITRNLAGVNDPNSPIIGVTRGAPASPFRFRGTTVFDWVHAATPQSRALSVSYKDRGAILPIGRARQEVYWYVGELFTTSRWYRDTLPDWVKTFNATRPGSYAGREWNLLLGPEAYPEPDSVPIEARTQGQRIVFPYKLNDTAVIAARQLPNFPFLDEVTADLALTGLEALSLGKGPQTDVLAVSFSALDLIGHRFGPDSREVHDAVLRLDRTIGVFLDSLFRRRSMGGVIIALTADHGVTPFPELNNGRITPAPMRVNLGAALRAADTVIAAAGGNPRAVDLESGAFLVERDSLHAPPEKLREAVDSFVAVARRTPGVLRAERYASLSRDPSRQDAITRRWVQMFPSDVPVEAVVTLTPGSYSTAYNAAMHGSPHDFDSHVPILFWGSAFRPGRYDAFVRTVDIAPTLAQVLGVRPGERLDGRPLTAAIR